jgi:hypothetical protein
MHSNLATKLCAEFASHSATNIVAKLVTERAAFWTAVFSA